MALPTALFAMIASFALASVAVLSSVDAQQGTKRDHESKEAIAAADAGANVALLRLNRFQRQSEPATVRRTRWRTPDGRSGGWCPGHRARERSAAGLLLPGERLYRDQGPMNVVAVGTSGTVSRRVEVGLIAERRKTSSPTRKLIGQESIDVKGSPTNRNRHRHQRGNLTSNGNEARYCGDDRHGIGKSPTMATPSCRRTRNRRKQDPSPGQSAGQTSRPKTPTAASPSTAEQHRSRYLRDSSYGKKAQRTTNRPLGRDHTGLSTSKGATSDHGRRGLLRLPALHRERRTDHGRRTPTSGSSSTRPKTAACTRALRRSK